MVFSACLPEAAALPMTFMGAPTFLIPADSTRFTGTGADCCVGTEGPCNAMPALAAAELAEPATVITPFIDG